MEGPQEGEVNETHETRRKQNTAPRDAARWSLSRRRGWRGQRMLYLNLWEVEELKKVEKAQDRLSRQLPTTVHRADRSSSSFTVREGTR